MSESFRPVENIAPELLALQRIQPAVGALHWQNFLKRLSNGTSEAEARALLVKHLILDSDVVEVPVDQLPLLDKDVDLSVAELDQYLKNRLKPQHSYLVRTGARPDKQRLPEVADLHWDDIPNPHDYEGQIADLETKQAQLQEEVFKLLVLAELYGDNAEINNLRDRFDAVKQAVFHLHRLDRNDPQWLTHQQNGLEKVIIELRSIRNALSKYLGRPR